MIFCINWDLVFEVRVANDSTSLPRSAPGQLGMVPAPTARQCPSQPDDIVGTGQIGDGRHRRRHTGICRVLENARENVSSEKTIDFRLI